VAARSEQVREPPSSAHVNFDLPQALIGVISDGEFDNSEVMARRFAHHRHVDEVLVIRVGTENREIAAAERPGDRSLADKLLVPLNRGRFEALLEGGSAQGLRRRPPAQPCAPTRS
jgi:hypothetical protein